MPNTVKSRKTAKKHKHVRAQDYQEMLTEAAYYNAEQYGFIPGFEVEEWQESENEIATMLKLH